MDSMIILAQLCAILPIVAAQSPQSQVPEAQPMVNKNGTSHQSTTQALLYGLLATTVTNLAALLGLAFTPLHRWRHYPMVISFMVATAVGSLFSTAVLVLIPESLSHVLNSSPKSGSQPYMPISVTLCAGSFGFFVLEFALRRLRFHLERLSYGPKLHSCNNLRLKTPSSCTEVVAPCENGLASSTLKQGDDIGCPLPVVVNGTLDGNCHSVLTDSADSAQTGQDAETAPNSHPTPITLCGPDTCRRLTRLDPVVWMIVLGDGLHNFMDGLSIGAGFTSDLRMGLSLTLSILCEELPHELGDFAILLRSGLSVGMAVLFNFGSACTAYIGFFLGFYLGERAEVTNYILALTAGFFLHIALADMLPELRHSEDQRIIMKQSVVGLFFLHTVGLLFGFGCILAVTTLTKFIDF